MPFERLSTRWKKSAPGGADADLRRDGWQEGRSHQAYFRILSHNLMESLLPIRRLHSRLSFPPNNLVLHCLFITSGLSLREAVARAGGSRRDVQFLRT